MFLRSHPGWTERAYDETDRDVLDLINALDRESARVQQQRDLQARREANDAAHRARIGLN